MKRLIFAVIAALLIALPELTARLYIVLAAPALAPWHMPDELPAMMDRGSLTPDGYFKFSEYSGHFYSISGNRRATAGQPLRYRRTIWVFGNSEAFGIYVPDALTMPSRLQRIINGAGLAWRVENVAGPGDPIAGELALMRSLSIQPGDLVIFDDGGIDLRGGNCTDRTFALAQIVCHIWYLHGGNSGALADFQRIAARAESYAHSKGATFIHFLQPSPDDDYYLNARGIRLAVPFSMMEDSFHLTAEGEALEASEIFGYLTTF